MTRPPLPRLRPSRRRCVGLAAALLVAGCGAAAASAGTTVDVWVDLSEPVAAARDATGAPGQAARVAAQQQQVAQALQALGAVELARVRHGRNAIAVRIERARLAEVRALDGVVRVRPVATLHPPKPTD